LLGPLAPSQFYDDALNTRSRLAKSWSKQKTRIMTEDRRCCVKSSVTPRYGDYVFILKIATCKSSVTTNIEAACFLKWLIAVEQAPPSRISTIRYCACSIITHRIRVSHIQCSRERHGHIARPVSAQSLIPVGPSQLR
jgi:hypothetical protein